MAGEKMKQVYAIATNITSPLGLTTEDNWKSVARVQTAIRRHEDGAYSNDAFWASKLEPQHWQVIQGQFKEVGNGLSLFEKLCVYSARMALSQTDKHVDAQNTAFILSTTKGNIELLDTADDDSLALSKSAENIAKALGVTNKPLTVSHACVSGVVALLYGLRLIRSGRYQHVIVTGADRFTKFVLNGFQSFQAIAPEPCRPFDADRKGINLGEAAATIILSANPGERPLATLYSGSTSNDANHISGPSRTGDELALAISRTLTEANVDPSLVNMISAHGTATLYNDEMESKAFDTAGLIHAAVHSMKGYLGHTLGAAGVVESAMLIEAIQRQQLIPSAGFETIGVPKALNVTKALQDADINYVLKTASGFGGCNAAVLWGK